MFTGLVETNKPRANSLRNLFILAIAVYGLVFSVFWIHSIAVFDLTLSKNQYNEQLVVTSWVDPIIKPKLKTPVVKASGGNSLSKSGQSNVSPTVVQQAIDRISDAVKIPDGISSKASSVPELPRGSYIVGDHNAVGLPAGPGTGYRPTNGLPGSTVITVDEEPPEPPEPLKPVTKSTPPVISKGVITGLATYLPVPVVPQIIKSLVPKSSKVLVTVQIDTQGSVIAVLSTSGNPKLIPLAVKSAKDAKFRPTLLSGVPVSVQGTIVYNFELQ
jgi:hypothetical protein